MLILKKTINDIPPDFYSGTNSILFKDSDSLRVIDSSLAEKKIHIDSSNFGLQVIDQHIVITTKEFIKILNMSFEEISTFYFEEIALRGILDFKDTLGVLLREIKEESRSLWIYSKSVQEIVLDIYSHDSAKFIGDHSILLLKESNLTCVSLSSKQILWEANLDQYSFKEGAVIDRLVTDAGYIILFAHDQKWSNYGLRVLNSTSGECIFSSNSLSPNFYLHQGKIYFVGRKTQMLKLMNKDTFGIEQVDLSAQLGNLVFETQCTPYFYENELYVALMEKGEDIYSYWGVIDLTTFELKFKTEMLRDFSKKATKSNKNFVSQIKANGKMVGVKVSGNKLHIFKNEI